MQYPNLSSVATVAPEALERLVYLVGPARGGTSIINMALGIHPQILVLPAMSHFVNHVWAHRRKVSERLFRGIFRMPRYFELPKILATLPADDAEPLRKYVMTTLTARNKDFRRLYQLYPLLYAMTPQNAKDPGEITCWHDKTNDWRNIAVVARYFPEARFVFVTRDPRGSCASLARRAITKEFRDKDDGLEVQDLIDGAVAWRVMMERFRVFSRKRPGRSLLVRFEDFMASPEVTLNRIFDFAAGKTLPDDLVRAGLEALEGGATNDPDESYQGISTVPHERWKKHLSPTEADLILAIAGGTARRLGYGGGNAGTRQSLVGAFRAVSGLNNKARFTAKLLYANALPLLA